MKQNPIPDSIINLYKKSSLHINYCAEYGRHTLTDVLIHQGTRIISSEPYASLILPDYVDKYCNNCYLIKDKLLRCSACKSVRYCSKSCQEKSWQLHKTECPSLRTLTSHATKLTPATHLLLKCLIKHQSNNNIGRGLSTYDICEEIDMLEEPNPEYLTKYNEQVITQHVNLLVRFAKEMPNIEPVAFRIYNKLFTNCFSILNNELETIGLGVFPHLALFNHSCSPNCVQSFNGSEMSIRALRKIDIGEELTIPYIDIIQTVTERRTELKEGFLFACQCSRCTADSKEHHSSYQILNNIFQMIKDARKYSRWLEIIEIANTAFKYAPCKEKQLITFLIRITEQCMDANIELHQWNEALVECVKLAEWYKQVVGEHFPIIALNYLKMAKLMQQLNLLGDSVSVLEKALRIVSICYGDTNSLHEEYLHIYHTTLKEIQMMK